MRPGSRKLPEVVLGLSSQLPILLGAVVAGNAAEHVAQSRGRAP